MADISSIAVVGGGIGGVTAALLLQKAGYSCQVYEQSCEITRTGAGINLYPNGTRVLKFLGLEKQLYTMGLQHKAKQSRDFDTGRLTYRIECQTLTDLYGAPCLAIHRGDLAQILTSSLQPGTMHLDRSLTALEDTGNHVNLMFANGATAKADIVIGADGVNSKVREILLGPEKPTYSGDVAYRGLFPIELLGGFKPDDHCKWWHNDRRFIIIYYITAGRDEAYFVGGAPEVWGKDEYSPMNVSSQHLLNVFHDFHPDVLQVLKATPEGSRWAVLERDPLPLWSRGRIVILGDACHPMMPYMGQGGSMALEDAAMLVRCLRDAGSGDHEAAFRLYEANRADRTRRIQLESKKGDWQRYEMDHEWVMAYDAFTVPLVQPKKGKDA